MRKIKKQNYDTLIDLNIILADEKKKVNATELKSTREIINNYFLVTLGIMILFFYFSH